tara:strand:- start:3767 stop:4522 length:756 start_codon:yes stop_codon:yes gene_type:complete
LDKEQVQNNRPVVILVEPQLGENIGAVARAMLNCGLRELRLVRPRDGWPNPAAEAMASGAIEVLTSAEVFKQTKDAVWDLNRLFATTARQRDLAKKVVTPNEAAKLFFDTEFEGNNIGFLFGPERSGLINDDIALADYVINVPLNPEFSSLNLAQAVLLVGYEWFQASVMQKKGSRKWGNSELSTIGEREYFYTRLEQHLNEAGFLYPEELAPTICRNLRAMFSKATLTNQEIRTLHGIVTALSNYTPDSK